MEENRLPTQAILRAEMLEELANELLDCLEDELWFHQIMEGAAERTIEVYDRAKKLLRGEN